MSSSWNEIRFAVRSLIRRPGFALVAVATLTLGLGANSAMFAVAKAVLFEPLPYPAAERLALIRASFSGTEPTASIAGPMLAEFRARATTFERFEAVWTGGALLEGEETPERVTSAFATPGLFSLLGVDPARAGVGRGFLPEETTADGPPRVILGHELWLRRFGGDPAILGEDVVLDGKPWTVIGVMPASFQLHLPATVNVGEQPDVWRVLEVVMGQSLADQNREMLWLRVLGRMTGDVGLEAARAEMHDLGRELQASYGEYAGTELDFHVAPLHQDLVASVRPGLLALLGTVAFVLLIACANVANLALARGVARSGEIALRAAFGASRGSLLRLVLIENLLLALVSGALGLVLASWMIELLTILRPADLPRITAIAIDAEVMLLSAGLALLAGLLVGLAPALRGFRQDLDAMLKRHATAGGAGPRRGLRDALVVAEVALAVVLLVGVALMFQSFLRLYRVDPGFDPEGLLVFELTLPGNRYAFPDAEDERRGAADFYHELRAGLGALPGVEKVAAISHLPLGGRSFTAEYWRDSTSDKPSARATADELAVLPGYFEAMGIALLAGRPFGPQDGPESNVVIVDQQLARQVWPGEPPGAIVGRRLRISLGTDETWMEVVGVARHVQHDGLTDPGNDQIYVPFRRWTFNPMHVVVRASGDRTVVADAIRRELARLDPALPGPAIRPMTELFATATAPVRFPMVLMGLFGAFAILLAAVGLYGTLAYLVARRAREISIRLAIGARAREIRRLVVRQGLALGAAGIVLGVLAAAGLTRFLEALLFGVTATDPPTYVAIVLLVLGVAGLACYLPARRAAALEPATLLRQ